jgi:hypothetical protein
MIMKNIVLFLSFFILLGIVFPLSVNAQTTEKKLNEVVVKKKVFDRSQIQMKKSPVVNKKESVSLESEKTTENNSNSTNQVPATKNGTNTTTVNSSKKSTGSGHQKGPNSGNNKPVPKF